MALFDSNFLQKLEYLSLVSRRVFRGELLAQKRTKQLGGGIEFADHREYAPGDDFRHVDWNLYARHGELLLKRFQEEQDLHVYVLLDCSRSMSIGNPSKFDLARRIAAALAYIALADLDRVAIVAFANGVVADFPLTRGKARVLSLLEFLEQQTASGEATNLSDLVTAFVHRTQRPGLAIVVSDFFDPQGYQPAIDKLRHHQFEPRLIQVHDATEADPQLLGDVELLDLESNELRRLTVTERNLAQYRQAFADFIASIRTYCGRYGLHETIARTDEPFDELILGMMRLHRSA